MSRAKRRGVALFDAQEYHGCVNEQREEPGREVRRARSKRKPGGIQKIRVECRRSRRGDCVVKKKERKTRRGKRRREKGDREWKGVIVGRKEKETRSVRGKKANRPRETRQTRLPQSRSTLLTSFWRCVETHKARTHRVSRQLSR